MSWDSDICLIFVIYQVYYSSWKQNFGLAQTNLQVLIRKAYQK